MSWVASTASALCVGVAFPAMRPRRLRFRISWPTVARTGILPVAFRLQRGGVSCVLAPIT
jgi:hypothetical protein